MSALLALPQPKISGLLPARTLTSRKNSIVVTPAGYRAKSPMSSGYWLTVSDGDRRALALYNRHYSAYQYKDGRERKIFVGPGEKMVLLTFEVDALFVWRKFRSMDNQDGVNCAVFRNESPIWSSVLLREAVELASKRWPSQRFYTYVAPNKIRSTNPGACFKECGWKFCGVTGKGLHILELLPMGYVKPLIAPLIDITDRHQLMVQTQF